LKFNVDAFHSSENNMFEFFQSPVIITLIIMSYFLFFFVLFLTKLPRTNGKHQISTDTSIKVAEESHPECTMFGLLEKLPKDEPIPDECMSCKKLVACLMKKKAFSWYVGQDSTQAE